MQSEMIIYTVATSAQKKNQKKNLKTKRKANITEEKNKTFHKLCFQPSKVWRTNFMVFTRPLEVVNQQTGHAVGILYCLDASPFTVLIQ